MIEDEKEIAVMISGFDLENQDFISVSELQKLLIAVEQKIESDFGCQQLGNVNDTGILLVDLKIAYKQQQVDFFYKQHSNNKMDFLFHAKEHNQIFSATKKIIELLSKGINPNERELDKWIKCAKEKQTKLIAEKNKPKKNKYYNKNTAVKNSLKNEDSEL